MSTNNFYFNNMLMASQCDCEDQCDCYDDLKDNVQSELVTIGFTDCDRSENDLRSYPGNVFSEKDYYKNGERVATIAVVIRSGYYAGANIDYTLEYTEDQEGEVYTIPKYIAAKIERDIKKMRKIVSQYTTELKKVGQFSNGEAVYQLAK